MRFRVSRYFVDALKGVGRPAGFARRTGLSRVPMYHVLTIWHRMRNNALAYAPEAALRRCTTPSLGAPSRVCRFGFFEARACHTCTALSFYLSLSFPFVSVVVTPIHCWLNNVPSMYIRASASLIAMKTARRHTYNSSGVKIMGRAWPNPEHIFQPLPCPSCSAASSFHRCPACCLCHASSSLANDNDKPRRRNTNTT